MENVERIVTAAAVSPNEENVDRALRPTLLSEYVGPGACARSAVDLHRGGKAPAASRSTICCSLGLRASEKRRLPTSWQTKWE